MWCGRRHQAAFSYDHDQRLNRSGKMFTNRLKPPWLVLGCPFLFFLSLSCSLTHTCTDTPVNILLHYHTLLWRQKSYVPCGLKCSSACSKRQGHVGHLWVIGIFFVVDLHTGTPGHGYSPSCPSLPSYPKEISARWRWAAGGHGSPWWPIVGCLTLRHI